MIMGYDDEMRRLKSEAELAQHTGFCMGDYDATRCFDCPTEFDCLRLYIREKTDVKRTTDKMVEIQEARKGK